MASRLGNDWMSIHDVVGATRPQGRPSRLRLLALKHFKTFAEISDAESEFLLQGAEASYAAAGAELLRHGAELTQPRLILSGWAGLYVILADGRRQFLDFALPGDLVGFGLHANAYAKASVVCLTAMETIRLPALANCLETPERFPGLFRVLHQAQDQSEKRLLNQIVRNGSQNALEKLASLLLELHARLAHAGLAQHYSFELPISQIVIADALGLSPVHVNRKFRHLKRDGILDSEGRWLTIVNYPALRKFAELDLVH